MKKLHIITGALLFIASVPMFGWHQPILVRNTVNKEKRWRQTNKSQRT